MRDQNEDDALDAERARLIGSIYDVVLSPEHYDSFMTDWSDFVDKLARRLGELHVTDGPSARQLQDPVIEAHFRRAFALFERMGRGEPSEPLGGHRAPLVRLGRGGVVLSAQEDAAQLFGDTLSLATIRAALEPDSAARLTTLLAAFDRAPASGRFAVLSLSEPPETGAGTLPGGGLVSVVTTRDPAGQDFVVELRAMSIGWSAPLASVLVETFHLTPRETELVRELTRGGDLPAVALRIGRSLNTLRAQLKSVFAKTRTNAQSELMRLIAAMVLHGAEDSRAEAAVGDGTEVAVDLGDGRIMPVAVLGPEDGLPVVFLHGMLEGLAALHRLGPALHAAGLRLYAPMRPNFGISYPATRIREAPDHFARDLGLALGVLGLSRVVVIGHMAGAIYAYGAAARLAQQVAGVVCVAGCVPIVTIEQFAQMTPRQRAVAYTARFAPALLPAVLRAGIAQIDSHNAQNFMTPLYPKGTRDREVVEREGIAEALLEGYRFTVAQGQKAFQIDAWHVTRDWSALVAASDCPVALIHGGADPVVRLESVRHFAQRQARVHLHEIDGEGQLLLYSQPSVVLAEIRAFAERCLA
ncbi:alpha/beta fold hydrolase [Pararhodobacter zhoushanensis]|uniref:alpha/beta fold hydrolase n=1 Tax=Pararhodobacter zhoushanensis TaxID=2479545 RepID=UPI0013E0919B|nr:alpha/beta fold hydrolase [Pararhodobacter zhoushanensis]